MDGALHVLVVDDDPDTALFVRTVLQRGGLAVTTCADPMEALTLAARVEFDAAITDIEMPGMTGLEFLDRLRQVRPDLPVTVMTAHASVDYAVDALRRNADEFLVKPVPKDTLAATIRRLAETAQATRATTAPRPTVLAIGAHPDDVEIGVGGTLGAHRSAIDPVVILTLSRGARGGAAGDRQNESLAAAELIGARLFLEERPRGHPHQPDGPDHVDHRARRARGVPQHRLHALGQRPAPGPPLQAHLPGDEYSVDTLADAGGHVVAAVPRSRLRVDSGVSVAGATVADPELEETARRVAAAIRLVGVANVQLRRDADGRPALLEVNPRFPGAMPLTVAAGVDMPSLALDLALGRPLPSHVPFTELAVVRYLEDVFVAPADLVPSETPR